MYNSYLKKIRDDHPLLGLDSRPLEPSVVHGIKPPEWITEGPLYVIFVRNFTHEGTFSAILKKITHLKELGIKTIWLMPIHPIGIKDRKGKQGSPYAVRDHWQIEPSLGTKKSFKQLIDCIHLHNMRIIMDLVLNHAAPDHVWTKTQPHYFIGYSNGQQRKIADWSDIVDFNYNEQELRDQMITMITHWITAFDIDGFRCDVAGLLPLDFWEEVYSTLVKIKKDVFLLAEWESAEFHLRSFHATYDWSTYYILKDIFEGKRQAADCLVWHEAKKGVYPANSLPLRFTENHDLKRTRNTFGEDSFYPFVVFDYTVYGLPMIYNSQEFGQIREISLFDPDPLDWSMSNQQILQFYIRLIRLRKKFPELASPLLNPVQNNHPNTVVSFEKIQNDQKMLVILNFCDQSLRIKMELPQKYHNSETFRDVFYDRVIHTRDLNTIKIKPYGFYILKPEK